MTTINSFPTGIQQLNPFTFPSGSSYYSGINGNMTQMQVFETIEKVASRISYKFVFASHTYEDIKQQAWIYGINGLEHYKPDLPLENFLWIHIKNRLCNFKRQKFVRIDKPCLNCPLKAYVKKGDICKKYKDKDDCSWYTNWKNRNEQKKNILMPVEFGMISGGDLGEESCPVDKLSAMDTIELIDKNISVDVRSIWLKARGGIKLLKEERELLKAEIVEIFRENNVTEW